MSEHARPGERGFGGLSLIGLLVCVALLVYLGMQMYPRITGAGGGGTAGVQAPPGKAATPTQRAESVECRSNLSQVRQAITMYQTSNERVPAQLSELGTYGVSASILTCPVGGAAYAYGYDARAGRVGCRYPGHERY